MIRRARLIDATKIIPLTEKFYKQLSYARTYKFDYETVFELSTKLIQHSIVFVLELEEKIVGVMAVSVHPFMFNKNELSAGEVIWWVEPEAQDQGWGRKLLQAADAECAKWGLPSCQLSLMAESPPHAQTLYEALGYQLTELSFTKEF